MFQKIQGSRSTWACELKWQNSQFLTDNTLVTLHVSVWVEITVFHTFQRGIGVTLHVSVWVEIELVSKVIEHFSRSRSTWACELKWPHGRIGRYSQRVTLHVSVWVEISWIVVVAFAVPVTLHVSVWVEIFDDAEKDYYSEVTLHMSVWVEMPFS